MATTIRVDVVSAEESIFAGEANSASTRATRR
jgi:F0F1-type ATP synthase epsilon subunit